MRRALWRLCVSVGDLFKILTHELLVKARLRR